MNYVENNIVLLAILFVALVMVCYLWCRYKKAERDKKEALVSVEKEKEFYQCLSETEESCYAYLRRKDLKILFLSANFEKMTGIDCDRIMIDSGVIEKIFDRRTFRKLMEEVKEWVRTVLLAKQITKEEEEAAVREALEEIKRRKS